MASPLKHFEAIPRRGKLVVLGVCASVTVLGIGMIGTLILAFSGGYAQWRLDIQSKPNFTSRAISQLRQAARNQQSAVWQSAVPAAFTVYAAGSNDYCAKGQHSFEVNDNYAYACELLATHYFGFDGDFKAQLQSLDTRLQAQGWRPITDVDGITDVLTTYYDQSYGKSFDAGTYTAADLPGANYQKGQMNMELDWAEQGDTQLILFANNLNRYDNFYTRWHIGKDVATDHVAPQIFMTQHFGMSMSLANDYYTK